eukprot:GHVR01191900.1.p1 GENE.GHVR01191900.1~~GHVR01191900.1.p1  ORF type:complete len:217 (+),score=52.79 GHVR01191900.1:43-693(+)
MGGSCSKHENEQDTEFMVDESTQPQVVTVEEEHEDRTMTLPVVQEEEIEDDDEDDRPEEPTAFAGSPMSKSLNEMRGDESPSKDAARVNLKNTLRDWWHQGSEGIPLEVLKDGNLVPCEFRLPYKKPITRFTMSSGTDIEVFNFSDFDAIIREEHQLMSLYPQLPPELVSSSFAVQGPKRTLLLVAPDEETAENFFFCAKLTWRQATKRSGSPSRR